MDSARRNTTHSTLLVSENSSTVVIPGQVTVEGTGEESKGTEEETGRHFHPPPRGDQMIQSSVV